jgi:spoIIIJ-associated protein
MISLADYHPHDRPEHHPTASPEEQLAQGQQWLSQLLSLAGLGVGVVAQLQALPPEVGDSQGADSLDRGPGGEVGAQTMGWLTIDSTGLSPQQVDLLIGDRGHVIDAIQYLANLMVSLHHGSGHHLPLTVDMNGYRAGRFQELQSLVAAAVAKVRESHLECELTGLSGAERRQVHTLLKAFPDVESFSRGMEPDRRLVICLRGFAQTGESHPGEYRGAGEYRGSEGRSGEYRGGGEYRGSDYRGSDYRGSDARGSYDRGSDYRGSDARGSDYRSPDFR